VVLFGLNVSTSAARGDDPLAVARRAEATGFDFVSANDHPCGTNPNYETWTMLSWIAASTSRVKVASRVLGVPYRAPAMVAKMAESLDRLSGGRLILGLGGGYSDEEFRAFGLRVPSPRQKVDGLEDAMHITRGLWSQRKFSYEGRQYHTEAAELEPKPEHPIPIWLGTYGPRALALTGRLANGWIPTLSPDAPPERIPAMRDAILDAANQAGRDADAITCVYNLQIRVDDRVEPDPYTVSGTPDAIVDRLVDFVELGFGAMNLSPIGPNLDGQIERLGHEIVPEIRRAVA
jgi:alkanesulfonate monooxygenase SsuD/methylene tetrahydromethanopterin reductase-like flavin-dependent oxidoreductase (luciferase family)